MNIDFFKRHGYQVCRDVIDADTIERVGQFLRDETGRAVSDMCAQTGTKSIPDLCKKIDDAVSDNSFKDLNADVRSVLAGHFPLETRLSQALWDVPRHPKLRALLTKVLNDDRLFLHMPPTARFVLPFNRHAGVPAHQDISYNPHMTNFVTVWVPFTQIDDECGGVRVFEGSNIPSELLTNKTKNVWLEGVPTEGFSGVHCTMAPGDVLILNKWIIHESVANRSDRIRQSIDYRFFPSRETSDKHHLDMQSWTVIGPRTK